jgi:hypothetical protein
MTNVNPDSVKKLREYSQQMGFDPLDLDDAIDTQAETMEVDDDIFDDEDLAGTTDLQSRAKNPVFQYAAAAVIGTITLGLPLSAFFSLGGGKTVAKTDTPDTTQAATATTVDPEVDKLKTNIALDVQNPTANADTTAKPAPPQNPSETQVSKQQPTVVEKTPTIKKTLPIAKTPTVAHLPTPAVKPVVMAQTPKISQISSTISRPVYRLAPSPYPKVASVSIPPLSIKPKLPPKPTSVQIITATKPQPKLPEIIAASTKQHPSLQEMIAAATKSQPKLPEIIAAVSKPQAPTVAAQAAIPPISFQEAAALSSYGGGDPKENSALTFSAPSRSEQALSPVLALPLGTAVIGHTITPYNSISKGQSPGSSDLDISLDQPIQLAQGYSLPVGTVIQFAVNIAENGFVQATSKGVYINNSAIKVPAGTFSITGENKEALVAQQRAVRQDELVSADTKTAIYGAISTVGQVLTQAGNQTVIGSTGIGTISSLQTNNPNPNILAAIAQGAFQPLLTANQNRTNTVTAEILSLGRINTLPINTKVKIFVTTPGVVQIPIADNQTTSAQAPLPPYRAVMQVKTGALNANYSGLQQDQTQQINFPQTPLVQPQANFEQIPLVQPQINFQEDPVIQPQADFPQLPVVQPQVNAPETPAIQLPISFPQLPIAQPQVNASEPPQQQVNFPQFPVVQPQVNAPETPAIQPQAFQRPQTQTASPLQPQQTVDPLNLPPQPQQAIYPQTTTSQPEVAYPQITSPQPPYLETINRQNQQATYPQAISPKPRRAAYPQAITLEP